MFEMYELPYAYDALEPWIDALTVEIHHDKHYAAYTENLNKMAVKAGVADKDITCILRNLNRIPDPVLRVGLRNNGGGYYNHTLYFSTIGPGGGGVPTGILAEKINQAFGSFEAFRDDISALALKQFGSGWAWLSVNRCGNLELSMSSNQDNPISCGTANTPIFTIDVWEHAYYLKYKNLRAEYVKNFFNVVDWKAVEQRYIEAVRSMNC